MDLFEWLISFYVLWTAGMFVVAPLFARFTYKIDYPQTYPGLEVHEAFDRLGNEALQRHQQLIALGFAPESAVEIQEVKGIALNYRQTKGAAVARLTWLKVLTQEKVYLQFEQIYASGRALCVSNLETPSIYRGLWEDPVESFQLPDQKDAPVLFDSFARIRSRMKMGMPAIPVPGSLARREEDKSNEQLKMLIDNGCYQPLRNGKWRPSLRTSYHMMWRMLPPLKNILLAREKRRAKAILAPTT